MRFLVLLSIAVPLLAQHGKYLNDSKNPAIGNPVAIEAGSKLYAQSCSPCHGPDGSGGRGPNLVRRALWHPLNDENIFSAIRNGIPGADMPPTKLPDDQTWELVAFVLALTGPAVENKIPGDPEAGSKIFWGSKAQCSNCHAIRGRGGRIGPDLTNIGGTNPLAVIREGILNPSKKLTLNGQEGVTVTLKNGETIKGVARNRSNYSLQVIDMSGNLHLINMLDVQKLALMDHSLMPADYAKRLSSEEVRDLLAYLGHQSLRMPEHAAAHASTN